MHTATDIASDHKHKKPRVQPWTNHQQNDPVATIETQTTPPSPDHHASRTPDDLTTNAMATAETPDGTMTANAEDRDHQHETSTAVGGSAVESATGPTEIATVTGTEIDIEATSPEQTETETETASATTGPANTRDHVPAPALARPLATAHQPQLFPRRNGRARPLHLAAQADHSRLRPKPSLALTASRQRHYPWTLTPTTRRHT